VDWNKQAQNKTQWLLFRHCQGTILIFRAFKFNNSQTQRHIKFDSLNQCLLYWNAPKCIEINPMLQKGPKVTSLVARSSRGRCTQHLRRIRGGEAHPAWIWRMSFILWKGINGASIGNHVRRMRETRASHSQKKLIYRYNCQQVACL
jgi:hypothetical protein